MRSDDDREYDIPKEDRNKQRPPKQGCAPSIR